MINADVLDDVKSMSVVMSYIDDSSIVIMNRTDAMIPDSILLDFADEHGMPKYAIMSDGSIKDASMVHISNWPSVRDRIPTSEVRLYIVRYHPEDNTMNIQMEVHGADKIHGLINRYLAQSPQGTNPDHDREYKGFLDTVRIMKPTQAEIDAIAGGKHELMSSDAKVITLRTVGDRDYVIIVHGGYSMNAVKDTFADKYLVGRTSIDVVDGDCIRHDVITDDDEINMESTFMLVTFEYLNALHATLYNNNGCYTLTMRNVSKDNAHVVPKGEFAIATSDDKSFLIDMTRSCLVEKIREYVNTLSVNERESFLNDVRKTDKSRKG